MPPRRPVPSTQEGLNKYLTNQKKKKKKARPYSSVYLKDSETQAPGRPCMTHTPHSSDPQPHRGPAHKPFPLLLLCLCPLTGMGPWDSGGVALCLSLPEDSTRGSHSLTAQGPPSPDGTELTCTPSPGQLPGMGGSPGRELLLPGKRSGACPQQCTHPPHTHTRERLCPPGNLLVDSKASTVLSSPPSIQPSLGEPWKRQEELCALPPETHR